MRDEGNGMKHSTAIFFIIISVVSIAVTATRPCTYAAANTSITNYILKPSELEAKKLVSDFFGKDAGRLKEVNKKDGKNSAIPITFQSGNSDFLLELDPQHGYFLLSKPSRIPTHYRAEGEGIALPPPSKTLGKYTVQEADMLCRENLSSLFGISADSIELVDAIHEDPQKERSRAYRLFYSYVRNGLKVIPVSQTEYPPYIEVRITDDGIVYTSGVCLRFEDTVASDSNVLSLSEITKRNPWAASYGESALSYYLQRDQSGLLSTKLVWYTYEPGQWFSGNVYDATTGKQIMME